MLTCLFFVSRCMCVRVFQELRALAATRARLVAFFVEGPVYVRAGGSSKDAGVNQGLSTWRVEQ